MMNAMELLQNARKAAGNAVSATGDAMGRMTNLRANRMPGGGISTYQGGIYCGPQWGFTKEDVASGKIKEMPAAVDAIDEACRWHDQCYQDHGYFTQSCNVTLTMKLSVVMVSENSTSKQRMDAAIMAAIFATESRVDPVLKMGDTARRQLFQLYETMIYNGYTFAQAIERGVQQMVGVSYSTGTGGSW